MVTNSRGFLLFLPSHAFYAPQAAIVPALNSMQASTSLTRLNHSIGVLVQDKLVASIAKFQQASKSCATAALGGCTFAMMIVYFELLDTKDLKLPEAFPRIGLWSNELLSTSLELDRIHKSSNKFGGLCLRDMSITALCSSKPSHGIFINTSVDIDNSLQTILPGPAYSHVREQLHSTYSDNWKDLITAAKPMLVSQILKTTSLIRDTDNSRVTSWPESPFCTISTTASINAPVNFKLDGSAFNDDDVTHPDTFIIPGMQPPEIIDIHPGGS